MASTAVPLTFGCAALIAAAVAFTQPSASQPHTVEADRFVDTVGVNVHLHYDHTAYKEDFERIKERLLELGVRHVRDGLIDTAWEGYYDRHNELGDAGIKGTFITSFDQSLELMASYPSRVSRSFEAYEAPNEPDRTNDPRWVQKLRATMNRLGELKQVASVSHFPIVGPSLTFEASYAQVGDVSAFYDSANLHNYLAGRHPGTKGWGDGGYGSIEWNLRLARGTAGGKPVITTEVGYQDLPSIEDSVPQDVVARYMPRLLIEQYRAGIQRTFIYELCDFEHSGNYGLLNPDTSPKPAFHAVKGLLNLLSDPGEPYLAKALEYHFEGDAGPVRHMAFQKRDGTYYLALWVEEPMYDVPRRLTMAVEPRVVTVSLPREMRVARIHHWQPDGHVSMSPIQETLSHVRLTIDDRLSIVELSPDSLENPQP